MWPLIERELRIALRRNAPRHRWHVALAAAAICVFSLGFALSSRKGGQQIFGLLLWFGTYEAVVPVLRSATDCFSQERRNGTLGLLFLAGLRPFEIFISKLSGLFLASFYNLVSLAPFMSLAFLSGGISGECFLATNVALVNLLLFTLSLSVFASVLCRDDGAAATLAIIVGGLICLAAPAVWASFNWLSGKGLSDTVLLFSPAYALRLAFQELPVGKATEFWTCSAITLGYSLSLLVTAATILRFTWQDQSMGFLPRCLTRWLYQNPGETGLRKDWLERNAMSWLVLRDRATVKVTATVIIVLAAFWGMLALAWPQRFATPLSAILTAWMAYCLVSVAMVVVASRRFGDDRANGSLELLLATRLSVAEIVGGCHAALQSQFRPLLRALMIGSVILAVVPLFTYTWNHWFGFLTYAIIWGFVGYLGFRSRMHVISKAIWVSLNTGRPIYSVWRTFNVGWWWAILAYNFFISGSLVGGFPSGSATELIVVSFIAVILLIVFVSESLSDEYGRFQWLLVKYFHDLSMLPVPPAFDPGWKKWDMKSPFTGYALNVPLAPVATRVV
jgi:ABC-type transport system involved in cytochrome c biogenesis permease component